MIKVITYGTFDHLHEGHINLLKRARALGDYLIVGVTTENFDIIRGKINVSQSLMERMEAVKATGLADEVFPEEYEGQKIEDVKRHNIDIFAIGSDWEGKFDYLKEFCKVIYLPRTEGISSTLIRSEQPLKMGIVGTDPSLVKFINETKYVNGLEFNNIYFDDSFFDSELDLKCVSNFEELLKDNDVIYVTTKPKDRYHYIKLALEAQKHVISDSPISLSKEKATELFQIAKEKNLCLYESLKTAYSLGFSRLILLIKSGAIGEVKSIDVTCTSQEYYEWMSEKKFATSFSSWGPIGMLPVLKILGINYTDVFFYIINSQKMDDIFTKATFYYSNAVATVNVGVGVKSEGDLRIAGTKGYIYVPSPWWKTEYFELRFEDNNDNKRYFFKLEGEGIRSLLVSFVHSIKDNQSNYFVEKELSETICKLIELHSKELDTKKRI